MKKYPNVANFITRRSIRVFLRVESESAFYQRSGPGLKLMFCLPVSNPGNENSL